MVLGIEKKGRFIGIIIKQLENVADVLYTIIQHLVLKLNLVV